MTENTDSRQMKNQNTKIKTTLTQNKHQTHNND